jgi:hypothetical protein
VEGVGSDDDGVWKSNEEDTDEDEVPAGTTTTARTTPSRSAKGKGKDIIIDDNSNDDMEDDDDGDSDEHGDDWNKKAVVQELEERAEKADTDQANEYEQGGLGSDDDSDWEKEGKEDYVPDGGEKQVDYAIVIATYGRSKTFEEKTYPLLIRHNLRAKATLFLQSPEDEAAYARFGLKIVRSPNGLVPTNNFIACYYDKDEYVVLLHDDVKAVLKLVPPTTEYDKANWAPVEDLDKWLIDLFKRMEATGRNLGGVYMHRNALSMSAAAEYCVDPNFIYAPLTLMINQQVQLPLEHAQKEDIVRSVEYSLLDGGVLRAQHCALDTVYNPPQRRCGWFRTSHEGDGLGGFQPAASRPSLR